jgi:peroxiredoxin
MVEDPKSNPDFVEARDLDAPLADKLELFTRTLGVRASLVSDAYQTLVDTLTRANTGATAPGEGDRLPPFVLPNEDGRLVSLAEFLANGPVVVSFNRGHWCPFCWLELSSLGDNLGKVRAAGGEIVSIIPETAKYSRLVKKQLDLAFPFLTDLDNGYGLELGVTMPLSAEVRALLEPAGYDLSLYQKNDSWFVPIPATFVVGRDGIIKKSYVNVDYRCRFDPDTLPDIIAELD